ncbi:MAG: type VII toxin-antitoxin system HepT family RNase toxin [Actinomycetota bacterium]
MVDPARLRALLDRIESETAHLHRLAALDEAHLSSDADLMAAVKYRFLVAIEASIDAGQHILSSEGFRAPESSADVFRVLGENGVLEQHAVVQLEAMARFRNLLVHGYAVVDDARVIAILRTHLGDFDSFRQAVARLVA